MNRMMTWFSLVSLLCCLSMASLSRATLTTPALTPANLPATGGTITVSATAAGRGSGSIIAQLYRDGVYYTQANLSNGNAGLCYTGTYTVAANTDAVAHTFTANVIAVDKAGNQEKATASGSCVVANDNTPPLITNATLTPASIPAGGGTLAVSATVTDAGSGVNTVTAFIPLNGISPNSWLQSNTPGSLYNPNNYIVTLSNSGSGNVYSGTLDFDANNTGLTNNFTAYVQATDAVGNSAAVTASGSCVQPSQAAAVTPPVISAATILPASLPATGGTLTINATVTDTNGPA